MADVTQFPLLSTLAEAYSTTFINVYKNYNNVYYLWKYAVLTSNVRIESMVIGEWEETFFIFHLSRIILFGEKINSLCILECGCLVLFVMII